MQERSLFPLQAVQREGLRESLGSEDDVSVSASDEGEAGLPRRGSGKRMGAMFNVANKGVTTSINAVGRGLAGTMQAVKVNPCWQMGVDNTQTL